MSQPLSQRLVGGGDGGGTGYFPEDATGLGPWEGGYVPLPHNLPGSDPSDHSSIVGFREIPRHGSRGVSLLSVKAPGTTGSSIPRWGWWVAALLLLWLLT